ncbi:lymphocyte antigen 6A-2/6E-1-like isoform X2 [Narcine bancroftii]|uniref:lymphocyte antigen 6A-2/6E-1-like isoform X2 n=1 Tax=Narcine bancroftii TaxID=1343680 RepID=UPI0038313588
MQTVRYLLLLGCGLIFCVSQGDCLRCFFCTSSETKCISNSMNCTEPDQLCSLEVANADNIKIYNAGCTSPNQCNVNFEQNVLGQVVSFKTSCCDTDLCNGSDHIKSPLLLCLLLVSLWSAQFL